MNKRLWIGFNVKQRSLALKMTHNYPQEMVLFDIPHLDLLWHWDQRADWRSGASDSRGAYKVWKIGGKMWRFIIVFRIRIASNWGILSYILFPTHTRMNLWIYLFNWCIMSVSSVHAQSMHVSACSSLEQKRPLFWPWASLADIVGLVT